LEAVNPKYKDIPLWVTYEERQKIDILNDLGLLDKNELAVFFALTEYAQKYQSCYLPLQGIYKYVYDYGLRNNNNILKIETNIVNLIKKVYFAMHKKKYAAAESNNNTIVAIILQDPNSLNKDEIDNLLNKLRNEYYNMSDDVAKPFPSGDYIPKSGISGKVLNIVSIKDLTNQKVRDLEQAGVITKILFPSGMEVAAPTEELRRIYDTALDKIMRHLQKAPDFSRLMIIRLKQQYPSATSINFTEDLIKYAENKPQFLVALATEVLNNIQNSEKEKGVRQSAEIIKFMAIQQSEIEQKKTHNEKSYEIILKIMENYPVAFTKGQLLQLREKHTYLKLYSERDYIELVNAFIQSYSTAESDSTPPLIIALKSASEPRYLHRTHFSKLFFDKIDSISYEIKKNITDRYNETSGINPSKDPLINSQAEFESFVDDYFSKQDPVVVQLMANPPMLYNLIRFAAAGNPSYSGQAERFFDTLSTYGNPVRHPLCDILNLNRPKLLKELKHFSPASQRMSLIGRLLHWLFGFGSRMEKVMEKQIEERKKLSQTAHDIMVKQAQEKAAQAKKEKEQGKEIQKESTDKKAKQEKILALKKQLENFRNQLAEGKDTATALSDFEKKWNHVINPQAREDNLRLVKSKVTIRLKFIKTPTPETIQKEINDIMKIEGVFESIHDRVSLRNYITLLMVDYFLQKL
jgi:hypothetical protein